MRRTYRLAPPLAAAAAAALLALLALPPASARPPAGRPLLCGVGLLVEPDQEGATRRALAELAGRPGVTHVAVFVDLHQDEETSPAPVRDPLRSPSDGALTRALREVRALGLEAVLVPRVRVGGRESTSLRPPSWPRWFEGYRRELLHWARLAESAGATLLAVGRGLRQAEQRDAEWRDTIRQVRGAFSGQLTYVAASDRPTGPGWGDLDYVGLSLWEPLAAKSTAPSDGELRIAAEKVRDRLRRWRTDARVDRPLLLLEVGFASQDGCALAPAAAQTGPPRELDLDEQARCWSATVAAWEQLPRAELAGCFAWGWSAQGGEADRSYSLLGKPALTPLLAWFQRGD